MTNTHTLRTARKNLAESKRRLADAEARTERTGKFADSLPLYRKSVELDAGILARLESR